MEVFIIGFCLAVCGTWLYLAKDYQHTKFASSQIQMLLAQNLELKKKLNEQEQSLGTMRSTFLSYKAAWEGDIQEVQNMCTDIATSQKRVSKSQRDILQKLQAMPIEITFVESQKSSQLKKIKSQLDGLSK